MSVDFNAGVIMGVSLKDLRFKIEKIKEKFELHDKKGKPTGKFDYDVKFKISFNDQEKIFDELYYEHIEEMFDLKDSKLKLHNVDYEDISEDNIILGIKLVKRGYDDWNVVKEIPQDKYSTVLNEFKKLNLNVENESIKLYFYFNAG